MNDYANNIRTHGAVIGFEAILNAFSFFSVLIPETELAIISTFAHASAIEWRVFCGHFRKHFPDVVLLQSVRKTYFCEKVDDNHTARIRFLQGKIFGKGVGQPTQLDTFVPTAKTIKHMFIVSTLPQLMRNLDNPRTLNVEDKGYCSSSEVDDLD